jgi:hypothetical protein
VRHDRDAQRSIASSIADPLLARPVDLGRGDRERQRDDDVGRGLPAILQARMGITAARVLELPARLA